MRPDEFEARMRPWSASTRLRLPPGALGRPAPRRAGLLAASPRRASRSRSTRGSTTGWSRTAQAVLEEFQGLYAYTESDEISVLLPRTWDLFDRELEKAVSLSAGAGQRRLLPGLRHARSHFDSRAVLAAQDEQVVDYFRWRQADAARCALNGWCYWTLRKAGQGVAEATAALRRQGRGRQERTALPARHQLQRGARSGSGAGTGLYWETLRRERASTRGGSGRRRRRGAGSGSTRGCRRGTSTASS